MLALGDMDRQHKDVGFCDVYHSAHRYNIGPKSHLPVILPSSVMYSFSQNRLVLGDSAAVFFYHNDNKKENMHGICLCTVMYTVRVCFLCLQLRPRIATDAGVEL